MEKVIIFGAGVQGRKILSEIKDKYEVVLIIDNDPQKNNTYIDHILVKNLNKQLIDSMQFDAIIIGTLSGYKSIMRQLNFMGVPTTKIITSWVELPTLAREKFVESLAILFENKKILGSVAEGGVFQGEFSAILNKVFSTRKLYLFDTFEGFYRKDIEQEKEFSLAKEGDYSITSIEEVQKKLSNPEYVVVKKGYFPDTAEDVDDKFCFVNLDFDLFLPTKNGLEWFEKRMVAEGIILVHDYFSSQYLGVKKAVDDFVKIRNNLQLMPIGDTISIAIIGF